MQPGKTLVTGATGFLGRALSLRLRKLGCDVTGLGRDPVRGAELASHGIRFLPCDLTNPDAVETVCAGQDYVFHCAALASPWGSYSDFFQANVIATRNVARASRKAGAQRMVFVSSPSIYVEDRDRLNVREDDPLPAKPINSYAATKLLAEEEVDRECAAGLSAITIRPQGIFGPGDRTLFPRLIRVARKGRFPVFGDGRAIIDLTYVDNVVDAMLLCVDSPVLGKKYNITNGEPVPQYEMLQRMLQGVGVAFKPKPVPLRLAYSIAGALELAHRYVMPHKEPVLTRYSVCVMARSRTLDISAARKDLGYEPRVTISEGIDRFVAWYLAWSREQNLAAG
jgi:nucleoside-diphosphate-sugar epimerase